MCISESMASATYVTDTDIDPLIGNLASQRSATAKSNAIAGATAYVNLNLGRTTNLDSTDPLLNMVKIVARYFAAAELLTGISTMEPTRQSLIDQANSLMQQILKLEQSEEIDPAIVETTSAYTWPANPNGIVYSNIHPNLRRNPAYLYVDMINTDDSTDLPE